MRLLHTSDWHLGRAFHRVNMLGAQAGFVGHLVETVREHSVDAVVVSGDVYDRAVPPLAAVELFDDALHRLAGLGVPTVMISGNHDSARRLGVGAGLIDRAGIHLRTDPAGCGTPVVLGDAHGDVAFYGLPYLEPALVKTEFGVEKAGHEAVLAAAVVVAVATGGPSAAVVTLTAVAVAVLAVQLAVVRPRLNRRSDAVLAGEDPAENRSGAHLHYVALEIVKVLALLALGCTVLAA